jgi:hypothetical protein
MKQALPDDRSRGEIRQVFEADESARRSRPR